MEHGWRPEARSLSGQERSFNVDLSRLSGNAPTLSAVLDFNVEGVGIPKVVLIQPVSFEDQ